MRKDKEKIMSNGNNKYEIGVYYFPNYHIDARNEKWHGSGWNEWELIKDAKARYKDHYQPRIPQWGYEDESKPEVMEKKIRAASDAGITSFIFDWYWYNDGPYLNKALDKGFLGAKNTKNLKFALMWANHDWADIHPCTRYLDPPVLAEGIINPEAFEQMTDYITEMYFTQENYWRIDGNLYFSLYMPSNLVDGFGSIEKTKEAILKFRQKVRDKGLGEIHLNAVVWCKPILKGEIVIKDINGFLKELGFDSITSYVWIHNYLPTDNLTVTYDEMIEKCVPMTYKFKEQYTLPYYPNVTVGWDSSPRTIMTDKYEVLTYPFNPIIVGNTPEKFKKALEETKKILEETGTKMFTINAWNEWTEGSYLEPDEKYGTGYLDAIREVFCK